MTMLPDWWEDYVALTGGNPTPIRDATGNLVVYDPNTAPGINPVQDLYVANNYALPSPFLSEVAAMPATGNTVGLPAAPINAIAAAYDLIIPNDPNASVLGRVMQFAEQIYGSAELGVVKHSSGYLASDPTSGIRPGLVDLPRIMLPPWANVSRR